MYALVFALALALAGCSKDTPTEPAPKVNPGADGVTSPPGLFPDPGELPVQGLNTLEQPDKYDIAADVLWGSMLGTEKKDMALVRALDGIRVLLSGVVPIDGKEQLYLGIDRADFARHDLDNLRAVLEKRFPSIPIFIEASDGIDLLTGHDADEDVPVDVFSDDFSNLTAWTVSSAWKTGTFTHPVPDEDADNRVAQVRSTDCTSTCTITTKPLDLSGYSSATLSLHRWLDDALDAGDTFVVEVGNDGVYRPVGSWGSDAGDDVWHYNTFTLDQQHLGEQTTVRITVTMSSFSGLFSLFGGGGEETEERVVAVDNVLIQGVEAANLVVHDVSVSPKSVSSGASVEVRYSVKNAGTADASKGNVFVYRHRSRTDTPATGGTKVSTFAMQASLAPGTGFSRAANVRTPSVSADTVIYYYVCVDAADGEAQLDDNCGGPVTATVRAKVVKTPEPEVPVETPTDEPGEDYTETSYPEPPYESCYYHSPERKYVMAGDAIRPQHIDGDYTYGCGTLTLAGVETRDGTKGFITAAHNAFARSRWDDLQNFNKTDTIFKHGSGQRNSYRLLGKVHTMPQIRLINNVGNYRAGADAAFVAYPRPNTADCSLTWTESGETFCLDLNSDQQIERAVPLKIRGKGKEVYTVTGSHPVTTDIDVWASGAVSGVFENGQITTEKKIVGHIGGGYLSNKVHTLTITKGENLIPGDSGSPVYIVPDKDGNTRIIGIAVGVAIMNDIPIATFAPWDSVTDALDLKPID